MAYVIQVRMDVLWVPDGAAGAMAGQNQANYAGIGSALGVGAVGASNSLELVVGETVPGGDAPTAANFNTAIGQAATDLETLMATNGAWAANSGTPLSIAQAWATGGGEVGM